MKSATHAQRSKERWLKTLAAQIVTMLPEDHAEAVRVLTYSEQLVERFLNGDGALELVKR